MPVTMKSQRKLIVQIATALLIILWVYTGSSKLLDFDEFRLQLALQTLPVWSKKILLYSLPELELLIGALLVFAKTQHAALWASMILMTVFTGYVGLAIFGGFVHVPCSCGGVIKAMGWKLHFVFNLFFLMLTCMTLLIHHKKGGADNT